MLILEKSPNPENYEVRLSKDDPHTINICCLVLKSCKLTKKIIYNLWNWKVFLKCIFYDPWKKIKKAAFCLADGHRGV